MGNFSAPVPSFYIQDHLGNTRVTYEMDCGPQGARRNLEYVGDYLPYGGILREHIVDRRERFLTTEHERDDQTQLDYRGARYSDSRWGVFMSVDPMKDKFSSWSPYTYVHNNPVSLTDPTGMSPDSTRIYNTIGDYQFTINDNLPNEDHFLNQGMADVLKGASGISDYRKALLARGTSEFYVGSGTRSQLKLLQSSSPKEAGFVLYPKSSGELEVMDITQLGDNSSHHFSFNPSDIKASLDPDLYSALVGGGHTHPNGSSPSLPLFGRLSDYSPMLNYSPNEVPAHMSIIAGSQNFTIYTTAQRNYVNNFGWSNSFPGRTSTTIRYNGFSY